MVSPAHKTKSELIGVFNPAALFLIKSLLYQLFESMAKTNSALKKVENKEKSVVPKCGPLANSKLGKNRKKVKVNPKLALKKVKSKLPKASDDGLWSAGFERTVTHKFVTCLLCNKDIRYNSTAKRVHKFRVHRDPESAADGPVPETQRKVQKKNQVKANPVQEHLPEPQASNPPDELTLSTILTSAIMATPDTMPTSDPSTDQLMVLPVQAPTISKASEN